MVILLLFLIPRLVLYECSAELLDTHGRTRRVYEEDVE